MFEKKYKKSYVDSLLDEIKELKREKELSKEDFDRKINRIKEDNEIAVKKIEDEHEFKMRTFKDTEIVSLEKKLNESEKEREIVQARVEQLESAFKEVGFDVKDAKEMMGKLVDGLSKAKGSEVNIVK